MKNKILILCIVSFLAVSCGSKKEIETIGYTVDPTESLGYDASGTRTLRVTAQGLNKKDAIEKAKSKAAYEVTFFGVHGSGLNASAYPIITNPTSREVHRMYFDKFFAKGGKFEKYVSIDGGSVQEHKTADGVTITAIVKVKVDDLRKQYIKDNIIEY